MSSVWGQYNIAWDAAGFFDFTLLAEHVGQGNSGGFSRSTGSVQFIPAVDSILTIDAEYNYMLGSGGREALLTIGAGGGPAPGVALFGASQGASTIAFDPPNGTLIFHGSAPLLAGESYAFGYLLSITALGGSPTNLSHANGYFHATITPVPEPATAMMLSILVATTLRRRPRRR